MVKDVYSEQGRTGSCLCRLPMLIPILLKVPHASECSLDYKEVHFYYRIKTLD
jgi:hypothetical protein